MGVPTDLRFWPIKSIFQHSGIGYMCRSKEIADKYSDYSHIFDLMKKKYKKNLMKKKGHL